jgi:superfamily II DNA or RNA helicase
MLARYGAGERALQHDMRAAVQGVRRLVGRRALPNAGLVIIDEAHNLKSTTSAVYRSLMDVIDQKFGALLFLTATPFQLGRSELLTIVDFFKASRRHKEDPEALARRRQALSDAMDRHVEALERFGAAWRGLSEDQSAVASAAIAGNAESTFQVVVADVQSSFAAACEAKAVLQRAMRPFVVRSVRDRDHRETGRVAERFITQQARVPLALVDRLLVEIMRDSRTFISSALISACSSWPALMSAAIMAEEGREPSTTRDALRELARRDLLGGHPKVTHTVNAVVEAVGHGEKTLVFVEREATGHELQARIEDALEALKSDNLSSGEAQRQALQAPTRFGWPSLRESYLATIFPVAFARGVTEADVDRVWADPRAAALWARCDGEQDRHDYAVEKRFWEHVLFADAASCSARWRSVLAATVSECVERILDPDYVLNGLDLVSGASAVRRVVPAEPVRAAYREPNFHFARALTRFRSPWLVCADRLAALSPDRRAALIDAAANAIATTHFRAEIAAIDTGGDPARHFSEVDRLLLDETGPWPVRFRALAEQASDAVRTSDEGLATERFDALLGSLGGRRADGRVVFVNGKTGSDTRQRAIDGFNTPLYPEVLLTTPVLGEGLDLHRFCRRVVHHDLPWNPAKLEQRTGRVDRVGSLAERLGRAGSGAPVPIEVSMPFVPGTYDELVHERVLARRREFRCLLGNRPEWAGDGVLTADEAGQPMPEDLVTRLQIDLAPR